MCFKKRQTPMRCVVALAACALVAGAVMLALAIVLAKNALLDKLEATNPQLGQAKKIAFIILIIFACVEILVSFLAILFKWCTNRCYACFYGVILMLTWPIIIAFGAFSVAVTKIGNNTIQQICTDYTLKLEDRIFGGTTNPTTSPLTPGDVTLSLDIYQNIGIDRYMCSNNCPCLSTLPPATQAQWISDQPLNRFNFKGTYTTYKACIMDTKNLNADMNFKAFSQTFTNQDDFTNIMYWLEFFEDEYDCAGVCSPSLFYWSKSIELGRPNKSCIIGIKDGITKAFLGIGICALVAGCLLFIVWIGQYCLWKKYD